MVILSILVSNLVIAQKGDKKEYHIEMDSGAVANFYGGGKIIIGKLYITNTTDFDLVSYKNEIVSKDTVLHTFIFRNGEKPSLGVLISIRFDRPVYNHIDWQMQGGTATDGGDEYYVDGSGGRYKWSMISSSNQITAKVYTPPTARFFVQGVRISKSLQ